MLLLLSALLAACGGGVRISNSNAKAATVAGAGQINAGANAGSDVSDINRTNPVVHKPGTSTPTRAPGPQNVAPAAGQPSSGSATDRCSAGYPGNTGVGPRAGGGGIKHPLPQCAVE
jgi:hypothetical protein